MRTDGMTLALHKDCYDGHGQAEPLILKYRLCRKTVRFLVHILTLMPQTSVRRILHLQIFHKNNELQSFFHYRIRDSFLREKTYFETKYTNSFTQSFFNVNCGTVSHKLHVQHISLYALQTHSVFFQSDSIFLRFIKPSS
jgi:hypothetical protein